MEDKLVFTSDSDQIELTILEQTTLGGSTYILAEANGEAYILKNVSEEGEDAIYEFVSDDESRILGKIFSEMLDISIE